MQRQNVLVSFTIQFNNPVQPPQWGAPALITQASIVTDANGVSLYQPAYTQVPAAASDITDYMLEQLQLQMQALGLQVTRADTAEAVAA